MSAAFHSPLAGDLQAFVVAKQALGRKYDWAERRLRSFDRVVARDAAEHGGDETSLQRAVDRWLSASGRPGTDIRVDAILARQFCLFRHRRDGGGYVPEPGLARPTHRFRPYILSSDEIRSLLRETQTLRGPNAPLRRATFKTLLLVLYCTGLRPGEPLRLKLETWTSASGSSPFARARARRDWFPSTRIWLDKSDGISRSVSP